MKIRHFRLVSSLWGSSGQRSSSKKKQVENYFLYLYFLNSLIIHQVKTKEIITVTYRSSVACYIGCWELRLWSLSQSALRILNSMFSSILPSANSVACYIGCWELRLCSPNQNAHGIQTACSHPFSYQPIMWHEPREYDIKVDINGRF